MVLLGLGLVFKSPRTPETIYRVGDEGVERRDELARGRKGLLLGFFGELERRFESAFVVCEDGAESAEGAEKGMEEEEMD